MPHLPVYASRQADRLEYNTTMRGSLSPKSCSTISSICLMPLSRRLASRTVFASQDENRIRETGLTRITESAKCTAIGTLPLHAL